MFNLSAGRFFEIIQAIEENETTKVKEDFIQGAFVGWQIQETLKGLFSSNAKEQQFNSYLKNMNLIDDDSGEKQKPSKEKAIQTASQILSLDRQKKGGEKA